MIVIVKSVVGLLAIVVASNTAVAALNPAKVSATAGKPKDCKVKILSVAIPCEDLE
jgi:hypothetical protein